MKIAHFGTFDVENYGDLLFPLLLERRLGGSGFEFVHVSPVGQAPSLRDCKPTIGFQEALAQCESWDAIVLGGGALVHGDNAGEVEKYRDPAIHAIAYPGLWLLPALISHLRGLPLIWNATGVPWEFSEERKRKMLQWACWQTDYLAVRDIESARVLCESSINTSVVPDTAVEVSGLWSAQELQQEFTRLNVEGRWPQDRYLALHLREWYAKSDPVRLAENIKQICDSRGAAALLLSIGGCHGDEAFARRIIEHLGSYPAFILVPESLRSVAAAIRHSAGYVGSSLHGAITAFSFARPFVLVANLSRRKFSGFLAHIDATNLQVSDWAAAATAVSAWGKEQTDVKVKPGRQLVQALDQHWTSMSSALAKRRTVPAHVASRLLETLSGMPDEWFPLVPMLEQSPLFKPIFDHHRTAWTSARRHLEHSAFLKAAAYDRLHQHHQQLIFTVTSLNKRLDELREDKRKTVEAFKTSIEKTKKDLQDQRRAWEEQLRAHATAIHRGEGQILELRDALNTRVATLARRDEQIGELHDQLKTHLTNIQKRDEQIAELREKLTNSSERNRVLKRALDGIEKSFGRLRDSRSFHFMVYTARRFGLVSRTPRVCVEAIKKQLADTRKALKQAKKAAKISIKANSERTVDAVADSRPVQVQKAPSASATPTVIKPVFAARPAMHAGQLISVVIPVYNAHDDLELCLDSVRRNSRSDHLVIAVDDASPDERIWPLLRRWAAQHHNFRAVRNTSNLGYTATVNRGSDLAGPGDLILLNSDTIVPPRWIEQMAACAYSRPNVATVTAISNAAGAFSVPEKNVVNFLPSGWGVDEMATFVEHISQRIRPVVPTGNGFCLYLTAAARAAVGIFDAENFPLGYGEENDFSMRASAAGLVNLIDDATYVFHRRSASIGQTKAEILQISRATLDRLHPEYTQRVRDWTEADPLDPVREKMKILLQRTAEGVAENIVPNDSRPCLLFILHDGTGGTRFTSEDLSDAMAARYRTILLFAALDHWTLAEYFEGRITPVRRYPFSEQWRVDRPMGPDRLAAIREICVDYTVALAHVRHLLASGPELLGALRKLEIPIVFSFHDFYTICPTIQLLDETWTYCAGRCTPGAGDCPLPGNWFRPPLPWLKHRYVHEHQRRMTKALPLSDAFVTTSEASRDLIIKHFPALNDERFTVIEHGRDLPRLELARAPVPGEPLRAIMFGALSPAKGLKLILELLEKNQQAGRPIELHILGQKPANFEPAQLGGIYHGTYERGELSKRISAIGPNVSLVPSLWPETYCHVLTESWAMGLPVLASDIGTLRDRVLAHGGGWLLPVGDSERWFAKLRQLTDNRQSYEVALGEVRRMELPDVAWMARQYEAIYEPLLQQVTTGNRRHSPTLPIASEAVAG
jgi:GT2 family glycosyltransferase/glycosyltransferase involved in cell wall biosynthesis/polysaccharide pyruvyl transferase WcaK-like protein